MYKQKQEEADPKKTITFMDFFKHCTIFDPYEIVIYNTWKLENGALHVHFRLKKAPDLSRKEIRELDDDPEKKASRIKL